jgi:hypothetical protein
MTNEATRRDRRQIVGQPIRRLLAARVLSRDVSHVERSRETDRAATVVRRSATPQVSRDHSHCDVTGHTKLREGVGRTMADPPRRARCLLAEPK